MAFTEALRPERTPGLELLATVISLPDPAGATLALERVAATAATWSEGGVPLYVYRRGRALAKAEARASNPFGFSLPAAAQLAVLPLMDSIHVLVS